MAFPFFQNGSRKTESPVCNTRSARNYLADEGPAIRETIRMLQYMTDTQKTKFLKMPKSNKTQMTTKL